MTEYLSSEIRSLHTLGREGHTFLVRAMASLFAFIKSTLLSSPLLLLVRLWPPLPPSPIPPPSASLSLSSTSASPFSVQRSTYSNCYEPRTPPIMSVQQRSKSAPQLAVSLTFQTPGNNTVQNPLYRRQQSFVHPPIVSPSTSRPQDEPFALSGFFPSYRSPLRENDDNERWKWLRGDEEEDVESVDTASEEDPTVPSTPVEYDESENPDRVIQREDKLGVLRLREYQTTPASFEP